MGGSVMEIKYYRNILANLIYGAFLLAGAWGLQDALPTMAYIGMLIVGIMLSSIATRITTSKYYSENGIFVFLGATSLVVIIYGLVLGIFGITLSTVTTNIMYTVTVLICSIYSVDVWHKFLVRKDALSND